MTQEPGFGRAFCYAGKWLFPLQNAFATGIDVVSDMPASHENGFYINGLTIGLLARGDSLRVKGSAAKIFRPLCIEWPSAVPANRIR